MEGVIVMEAIGIRIEDTVTSMIECLRRCCPPMKPSVSGSNPTGPYDWSLVIGPP